MVLCTATLWYLCILDLVIHLGFHLPHFPLYCHCFISSFVSSSCWKFRGYTFIHLSEHGLAIFSR
ncbi:hypothetical protein GGI42DRAFT_325612 [Trichoderma sp. SZMC 28013]